LKITGTGPAGELVDLGKRKQGPRQTDGHRRGNRERAAEFGTEKDRNWNEATSSLKKRGTKANPAASGGNGPPLTSHEKEVQKLDQKEGGERV